MRVKHLSRASGAKTLAQVCYCIHLEERAHFPNSHKNSVSMSGSPAHRTFIISNHIVPLKRQMATDFKESVLNSSHLLTTMLLNWKSVTESFKKNPMLENTKRYFEICHRSRKKFILKIRNYF